MAVVAVSAVLLADALSGSIYTKTIYASTTIIQLFSICVIFYYIDLSPSVPILLIGYAGQCIVWQTSAFASDFLITVLSIDVYFRVARLSSNAFLLPSIVGLAMTFRDLRRRLKEGGEAQ